MLREPIGPLCEKEGFEPPPLLARISVRSNRGAGTPWLSRTGDIQALGVAPAAFRQPERHGPRRDVGAVGAH